MTIWFDLGHDLDLALSRSNFEIAVFLGIGGPIDIEQKGCESIIHGHDHDFGDQGKDLPDVTGVT